tara:strand:- start:1252 stop:2175 length:924 start_codon:yes stop_codon:yes gene_type:complete
MFKTMRLFLKHLLKFAATLAVVTVVLWFAAIFFRPIETHFIAVRTDEGAVRMKTEEFFGEPRMELDFLFLGSSTCYCGVDPRALESRGKTAFSLCSSAQRPGNSSQILDLALVHSTPRYVVVDLYSKLLTGGSSSVECSRDWIVNGPSSDISGDDLYNNLLKMYFELSRCLSRCLPQYIPPHHTYAHAPSSDSYEGLGFVARDKPALDMVICDMPSVAMMSKEVETSLLSIMNKSQIIFIIPPTLCPDTIILPTSLLGIDVIDGNLWPGALSPSNYYDDHHLISSGASSYSGWLSERLILLDTEPSL